MNNHFFFVDGKGLRCDFDNWGKTRTRLKLCEDKMKFVNEFRTCSWKVEGSF